MPYGKPLISGSSHGVTTHSCSSVPKQSSLRLSETPAPVEEPSPPCWAKRPPRHRGPRAPGAEPLGAPPVRRVVGQLVAKRDCFTPNHGRGSVEFECLAHSLTELLPHTKQLI